MILRKHLKFLTPHDLSELLDMEGAFEVKEKVENSPVYFLQTLRTTAQS